MPGERGSPPCCGGPVDVERTSYLVPQKVRVKLGCTGRGEPVTSIATPKPGLVVSWLHRSKGWARSGQTAHGQFKLSQAQLSRAELSHAKSKSSLPSQEVRLVLESAKPSPAKPSWAKWNRAQTDRLE